MCELVRKLLREDKYSDEQTQTWWYHKDIWSYRIRKVGQKVIKSMLCDNTLDQSWKKWFCNILHDDIVTRLVTVDGYWIDNWIYYNRTLKYNTTQSLRTPSVLQLTTHSAVSVSTGTALLASLANTILVAAEFQVPFPPFLATNSLTQLTHWVYHNNSAAIVTPATLVTGELQVPFLPFLGHQPTN
jgi:hypothetical protein